MIQFALAIWSLVPLPFLNLAFWNFFSQGYMVVVQSLSHVWHFVTPWTTAGQASLSLTISEFAQVHVHWIGDTIQPSHPLLSFSAFASIFPSIRVFSSELNIHNRWLNYWTFSFSISPSNEYSGLISFRIDWFDLCAVQGTLKSLLQHHRSKASILQDSAFFIVHLLCLYMTTGKAMVN